MEPKPPNIKEDDPDEVMDTAEPTTEEVPNDNDGVTRAEKMQLEISGEYSAETSQSKESTESTEKPLEQQSQDQKLHKPNGIRRHQRQR